MVPHGIEITKPERIRNITIVKQGLHQNQILPNKFGPILPEYGLNGMDLVDSELIRLLFGELSRIRDE